MIVDSQVKDCFSSIKRVEETLHNLVNNIQDQQEKQNFENALRLITEIKNDLQKQVMGLAQGKSQ